MCAVVAGGGGAGVHQARGYINGPAAIVVAAGGFGASLVQPGRLQHQEKSCRLAGLHASCRTACKPPPPADELALPTAHARRDSQPCVRICMRALPNSCCAHNCTIHIQVHATVLVSTWELPALPGCSQVLATCLSQHSNPHITITESAAQPGASLPAHGRDASQPATLFAWWQQPPAWIQDL